MNTIAPSLGSSLVLVFAASAVAQTGIIHEVTEESSAFDWLGYTMDSAGDVDGDGWMDVFVGIPRYNPSGAPYPNGAVGVYSGFDGSRLKLGVDAYIDLEGTPTPGGEVSLFALSGEFVPTMAALFLGATGTSLPAGHGCTLYVGPPQIVAFLPTDEFGRIDYAFDTPVTFPLGPIHVQAFFADAKTPVGFTATAGRVIDFQ